MSRGRSHRRHSETPRKCPVRNVVSVRGDAVGYGICIHWVLRQGRQNRHLALGTLLVQKYRGSNHDKPAAQLARRMTRTIDSDGMALLMNALSHRLRIVILFHLFEGQCAYGDLTRLTGLGAGPLYHHIHALRAAGLIGPPERNLYCLTDLGYKLTLLLVGLSKLPQSKPLFLRKPRRLGRLPTKSLSG